MERVGGGGERGCYVGAVCRDLSDVCAARIMNIG